MDPIIAAGYMTATAFAASLLSNEASDSAEPESPTSVQDAILSGLKRGTAEWISEASDLRQTTPEAFGLSKRVTSEPSEDKTEGLDKNEVTESSNHLSEESAENGEASVPIDHNDGLARFTRMASRFYQLRDMLKSPSADELVASQESEDEPVMSSTMVSGEGTRMTLTRSEREVREAEIREEIEKLNQEIRTLTEYNRDPEIEKMIMPIEPPKFSGTINGARISPPFVEQTVNSPPAMQAERGIASPLATDANESPKSKPVMDKESTSRLQKGELTSFSSGENVTMKRKDMRLDNLEGQFNSPEMSEPMKSASLPHIERALSSPPISSTILFPNQEHRAKERTPPGTPSLPIKSHAQPQKTDQAEYSPKIQPTQSNNIGAIDTTNVDPSKEAGEDMNFGEISHELEVMKSSQRNDYPRTWRIRKYYKQKVRRYLC